MTDLEKSYRAFRKEFDARDMERHKAFSDFSASISNDRTAAEARNILFPYLQAEDFEWVLWQMAESGRWAQSALEEINMNKRKVEKLLIELEALDKE